MNYEQIIREKFPKYNVEVLQNDIFTIKDLIEYICDDIVVYNPHLIIVYRHLIRFFVNVGQNGKMYYLENFSEEDLDKIYEGIRKFTFAGDVKINILPNANPDKDILGLDDD